MAVPEHSDCDAADQERADLKAEVERLREERDRAVADAERWRRHQDHEDRIDRWSDAY